MIQITAPYSAKLIAIVLLYIGCVLAPAQTAAPLDSAAAKKVLSGKMRNPIKSAAPVIKRTYARNPVKGLEVEIVERSDGTKEERPYVAVPLLFRVGTDELLDEVSRENVRQLSAILRVLVQEDPSATFTIQGHTSAEGATTHNQQLSDDRAMAIHAALVRAGVPSEGLRRIGFGAQWAVAPADAPEARLQLDRRVLVVRN